MLHIDFYTAATYNTGRVQYEQWQVPGLILRFCVSLHKLWVLNNETRA